MKIGENNYSKQELQITWIKLSLENFGKTHELVLFLDLLAEQLGSEGVREAQEMINELNIVKAPN